MVWTFAACLRLNSRASLTFTALMRGEARVRNPALSGRGRRAVPRRACRRSILGLIRP